MTLRHLEIFMAVCRCMSMSKAAEELNMTQPAVSKAVSELEAFYNVTLFDRLNRRIYLTEAGKDLCRYADVILSQFEESVSFLRDESSVQTCRLSVNVTAGESILAGLLQTISGELPSLEMRIGVHSSAHIEDMLKNNECDIGIIDEKDDSHFDVIPLYEEETGLFAHQDYEISERIESKDLNAHRLLVRESGSGSRRAADTLLREIRYPQSLIWESSSFEALLQLAEKGFGIAVLPVSCVSPSRELKRIRIKDASLIRRFYLVSLRNKYLNTGIRQCMRIIEDYCKTL